MSFFKLYLVSVCVFFAIDLLWLGVIAKSFYKDQIGFLMAEQIRWGAALLFYVLYLIGLVFFVISPALKVGQWNIALLHGALFGLICYATYDLTNLATLKDWPVAIVVCDLIWGTFVSAATSVITYWIAVYTR